ncbi:hypothetical protein [Actinospica robiniae]|uniref:hypothetical protein n=1 Tax=Actinospica robiniae TaxID=304901 RepID=UPI0003FF9439|nr:hypothetical protein [Actinospica robiniae]
MTSDPPALAGLDDVDWASLEHAYGLADDVPAVLRALASRDDEQAEAALDELHGSIWHQGSVYPATVPAVLFLAGIAASGAAGSRTAEVLQLLGRIAKSTDLRGIEEPDAVRGAVAAQYDAIATLLNDPDAEIRTAATLVLVHGAAQDGARSLILQRWRAETEALPRAELLRAMVRVDAPAAAVLADEALEATAAAAQRSPDEAVLRVSCALAWILAGRAFDERALNTALAPIPADSELFYVLVDELAERQGPQAAVELLVAGLERALGAPSGLVDPYLLAARGLITAHRTASGPLATPLARLLDWPGPARRAVSLLELLEPAAAAPAARDRLVALARTESEPDSDDAVLADEALACLARWNDAVVPGLLAGALTDRPQTLDAVAGYRADREGVAMSFHVDLLAAIRRRLNEICDAAHEPSDEVGNPFILVRTSNEPAQLAKILTSWGTLAQAAAPELTRILGLKPVSAARALAAIRAQSPACVAALHDVARSADGRDAVPARVAAAQAIRTLTREAGPLLAAVQFGLTTTSKNPDDRATAADAVDELSEHADLLVPLLLQALQDIPVPTPSLPAHQARMALGRALWHLTTRPAFVIEVLRDVLDLAGESLTGWTVARAAEFVADHAVELGPQALELIPGLEAALADPISTAAAARALSMLAP